MILLALSLAIAISEPSFEKTRDDLVLNFNGIISKIKSNGGVRSHSYFVNSLNDILKDFEKVTNKYDLEYQDKYNLYPHVHTVHTKNYNVFQSTIINFSNNKSDESIAVGDLPRDIVIYYPQLYAIYVDLDTNPDELSIFNEPVYRQDNIRKINNTIYDFFVKNQLGGGEHEENGYYFHHDYSITKATNDYISMMTMGGYERQEEGAITISLKTFKPMKISDFISLKTIHENFANKKYSVNGDGKDMTKDFNDNPKLFNFCYVDKDSSNFYIKDNNIVLVFNNFEVSMKLKS